LILVGAFTRLSDSGLGCPDWPGCYGSASPWGAKDEIHAAQTAMPTGPVTHFKAWVEMLHRYLASGVGFLILVACIKHWRLRADPGLPSPWWSSLTLVWVLVQGLFGAWTVTMKLFPVIVTLHLLLALGLLALLGWQSQLLGSVHLSLNRPLRRGLWLLFGALVLQVALGGWVSTNYAVLACKDFPSCQGSWWPTMDFAQGFSLWRELGMGHGGQYLPFPALVAIHWTHRLMAMVVFALLGWMAWRLWHESPPESQSASRRWALLLLGMALWQFVSGLSNVVLDWPLPAALAHTGGAAALVLSLSLLLARSRPLPALFSSGS